MYILLHQELTDIGKYRIKTGTPTPRVMATMIDNRLHQFTVLPHPSIVLIFLLNRSASFSDTLA